MRWLRALVWIVLCTSPAFADYERALTQINEGEQSAYEEGVRTIRAAGEDGFKALLFALEGMCDMGRQRGSKLLLEMSGDMQSLDKYGRLIIALTGMIDDPIVRDRLASMIAKLGPRHLPRLVRQAIRGEGPPLEAAREALARMGGPAWPKIRLMLDATSDTLQAVGLDILTRGQCDFSSFEPRVIELCGDKSPLVRSAAVRALAHVTTNRTQALEMLLEAFDATEPGVHGAAVYGLDQLGADGVRAILRRIEGGGGHDVEPEIESLSMFRRELVPEIVRGLESDSPLVRLALLRGLRPHFTDAPPPEPAWRALIALTGADDAAVRLAACRELVETPAWELPGAKETRIRLSSDASSDVRTLALEDLARRFAAADLLPTFQAGWKDDSADVRAAAWLGLYRISAPGLPDIAELERLLVEHQSAVAARTIPVLRFRAEPLLPSLMSATGSENGELAIAATRALGDVLRFSVPGSPVGRSVRIQALRKPIRSACDRAWAWLAKQQTKLAGYRGRGWDCDANGGHRDCDIGVTGLALMAFAAGGLHAGSESYGTAIRDGVALLRSAQREDGFIGDPRAGQGMIQHAIATLALCELEFFGAPDGLRHDAARRGLDFAIMSRNPFLGWRYRPRSGRNDTFVTTWMITALRTGEMAGFANDPDACPGALLWLDKMTDPEFGQVGYNVAGGSPTRPVPPDSLLTGSNRYPIHSPPQNSQATTAMGVWIRVLLRGKSARTSKLRKLGTKLITDLVPSWKPNEGRVDLIYWMFGARVLAQFAKRQAGVPSDPRVKWQDALVHELRRRQNADGSWSAQCVWGLQGGRVYSTAMAVLCLLAPAAYGPELTTGERPPAQKKALDHLVELSKGDDEALAAAAAEAIERLRSG